MLITPIVDMLWDVYLSDPDIRESCRLPDCYHCKARELANGKKPVRSDFEKRAVLTFLLAEAKGRLSVNTFNVLTLAMSMEAEDPAFASIYGVEPSSTKNQALSANNEVKEEKSDKMANSGNATAKPNTHTVTRTPNREEEDIVRFKNTGIVREGERIILPKDMSCEQAIEVLVQQVKEEESIVEVNIVIDAYPFEGARAFQMAMAEKFGWINFVPTPMFWGEQPPLMLTIDTAVGKTEQICWGRVAIPLINGFLTTEMCVQDNRFLFRIGGTVKKKSMLLVNELADLTRQKVRQFSLYKGKAVRFSFPDPKDESTFDPRNCPKFIDTSKTKPEDLIFSDKVQAQLNSSVFFPIMYTERARARNVSLKRGTLLAGVYGVGKSMAAAVAAHLCEKNGWTFLYLEKAEQLPQAIRFAKNYGPAVIFAEDVDKVTKGERNKALDDLLNTIDGVDTKHSDIMLVFTTNNLGVINEAILRAGRLDNLIEVTPPDAAAVRRLILSYTKGNLLPEENIDEVAAFLAGQIPATIADVCARASLSGLDREEEGIRASDLLTSAELKLTELKLVRADRPRNWGNSTEKAAEIVGEHISQAVQIAFGAAHAGNGKSTSITAIARP